MKKLYKSYLGVFVMLLLLFCSGCSDGGSAKVQLQEGIKEAFLAEAGSYVQNIGGPLGTVSTLISEESSSTHDFHLSYPKSANDHFNRVMRGAASSRIKAFHALREEYGNVKDLSLDYQVKLLDDNIVSILLLSKISGDNFEYLELTPENFSIQTGYPIRLGDVFRKDSGYEAYLVSAVTDELVKSYRNGGKLYSFSGDRNEEKLREEITLNVEDLSDYYFDEEEICFVIKAGKAAPQDVGPIVVSIAKEQLGEYLIDPSKVVGAKPTPMPTPGVNPDNNTTTATGKKYVALTFDDGPHATYTQELLDILKEKNVKVTFFCLGTEAVKYPEVVKRAKEEGHLVCSHTWSHKNLNSLAEEDVKNEISRADEAIKNITGVKPKYIRVPYGNVNDIVRENAGRVMVNWSVDPEDWKLRDAKQITERIVKETKEGNIILCHDIYSETVQSVGDTIDQLRNKGYEFVTVDQLFSIYHTDPDPGMVVRKAK